MKDLILNANRINQLYDWRNAWKKYNAKLKKLSALKNSLEDSSVVKVEVKSTHVNHGLDVVYETQDLKESVLADIDKKVYNLEVKQREIEVKLEKIAKDIHDEWKEAQEELE